MMKTSTWKHEEVPDLLVMRADATCPDNMLLSSCLKTAPVHGVQWVVVC